MKKFSLMLLLFIFIKQDTTDQENPEVRRMFNSMNGGGSYNNYPASNNVAAATPDERMALNRLQYEMVANYVQNK